jgi:hypothetical protein
VRSHTTHEFRERLDRAPEDVRAKAEITYRLWQSNPSHPSLRFKKVHTNLPVYSVRIDIDWRALGVVKGGEMVWFWIGPHKEYERLLDSL